MNEKMTHKEREEKILKYWKDNKIFEKSIQNDSSLGEYTFYDGPPFATGLPHYGHILAGTIKDVIPRFKTMQGYKVNRRWGWDCHGLPVENLIEKELGLKSKKDIVNYGIDRFNAVAKESVMKYADEWRRIIPRLGRWVDMDNDYRTMDATYTESIWWAFSELHKKGLIYKGFKSMNICPHCETTLSNFEVTQGYKDITDISVYVKFKIKDVGKIGISGYTYFVAWTTTPWTLPGNVALAVNRDIDYVVIKIGEESGQYIIAKERVEVSLKGKKFDVVKTLKGQDLIGLEYEPIFNYYVSDINIKNRENSWKVYDAPFVTTTDGTGIVHIAPAFGSDDYELSLKNNLPFIQHVNMDGTFKSEVVDFAGQKVKPKDSEEDKLAHQKTDVEVLKWLVSKGFLFDKEKIVHSYPHCWRCDTPLLNYATSSWFVRVTELKDKLISENNKIKWIPESVGQSRFGNWLEGARDWAISRSRFWGAPIPVWMEENSSVYHVFGSIEEMKNHMKSKNSYTIMRHGEAENNTLRILSGNPENEHHLTQKGIEQVGETARQLKGIKYDHIFVSPYMRTKETLGILRKGFDWTDEMISFDSRLEELGVGDMEGKDIDKYFAEFPLEMRFEKGPKGGETYLDIKRRMGNFIYDIDSKFEGKNILIITHETPAYLLECAILGLTKKQCLDMRRDENYLKNAEAKTIDFFALPHNSDFEIELHRPYIDDVKLFSKEGKRLMRVPDVFDCWYESGSMPFASNHYPFGNKKYFDPQNSVRFPADFIAEGLDQTRGWFYSLLVLGVGLFGQSPYKKVIVNGLVLAEDGQKMSKSKKNYPDPMMVVERFGADALRFYLLSSPVVRSEDLCFSEKGVDEVVKKIINRLLNVFEFYKLYSSEYKTDSVESNSGILDKIFKTKKEYKNVLDKWIIARLNEAIVSVTQNLEEGNIDKATRPIYDLVEDLSTWYLRRSRDRFKASNNSEAMDTLGKIMIELSKLIAPFMPFLSEYIYLEMKDLARVISGNIHRNDLSLLSLTEKESVHLCAWSEAEKIDNQVLVHMEVVRLIASQGLEARAKAKINVRQPLALLKTNNSKISELDSDLIGIIEDEVNVKKVYFEKALNEEISLDTNISEDLKEEGNMREFMRAIQELRKSSKLTIKDRVNLIVDTDEYGRTFLMKYMNEIKTNCLLHDIRFKDIAEEYKESDIIKIGDSAYKVKLE